MSIKKPLTSSIQAIELSSIMVGNVHLGSSTIPTLQIQTGLAASASGLAGRSWLNEQEETERTELDWGTLCFLCCLLFNILPG